MKKIFLGLVVAVIMPVAVQPAVNAVSDQSEQTAVAENQTSDTTEKDKKSARIQEYKDRVAEKISKTEEDRVVGLCKAAQSIAANAQTNLDKALEKRQVAYQKISDKLSELVVKLKAAGVDTTELEAAMTSVETQSAQIVALVQTHQVTLSDLASMDCVADPAGFKAALAAARGDRKAIVVASQALRQYIADNLKAILSAARENLATSEVPVEKEQ